MWLLEPLMMEPLMVAFDVLDVCLAFGSIIGVALLKSAVDATDHRIDGNGTALDQYSPWFGCTM